jgi:O-antigen ligase
MTSLPLESPTLDHAAATRWPRRAAADVLGLGLVAAVLVALPVAPSDLDRHQLPKETIVHFATWMAVVLSRPALTRGMSRAAQVGLGLFLALSLISAAVATNPWIALRATALSVTGVVAFLTAHALAEQGLGDRILRWCGVAAAIGVATALAQAYGAHSVLFAATRAPGGTFGNRNFMAHFAALALPVLVTLTLTTRRGFTAALAAATVGALTIGIVLSRSRTAWLAAPCGLAAYLLLLLPAWKGHAVPVVRSRAILLAAAVVTGAIGAIAIPNTLRWMDDDSPYAKTLTGIVDARGGSGRGRLIQYRNTLPLVAQHPLLGVGPGNWPIRYGDVAPPNDPSWAYNDAIPLNPWPSSDWIALLSERGVAAVLAILLVGGSCLWRAMRAARTGGMRTMAAATLAALLVIAAAEGSFDALLLLPAPLLLVAIAAGALLSAVDRTGVEFAPVLPASRWGIAVAALLGVIVIRSGMQTAAYVVAGNGRSIARLTWAARIDPTSYPIRIALAMKAPCSMARDDARAALRLAPGWPAPRIAARRCGGV